MKDYELFFQKRPDIAFLYDYIPANSRVLDLGCADGFLLHALKENKNCSVQGIDLSQDMVMTCISKGVSVIQNDLNSGLNFCGEKSFDYVVMGQTFQQVKDPQELIREMLRVGRESFVSMYNIAYMPMRLQIAFKGRMPYSKHLPYEWYNTPNIHLGSVDDFSDMCRKEGFGIKAISSLNQGVLAKLFPNSWAELALFILED